MLGTLSPGAGYLTQQFSQMNAPSAPTSLSATTIDAYRIRLSWTSSGGASSYSVYRGPGADGESGMPIATGITTTTYVDTGLIPSTIYFYKVTAANGGGESADSNEASATTSAAASGGGMNAALMFQILNG